MKDNKEKKSNKDEKKEMEVNKEKELNKEKIEEITLYNNSEKQETQDNELQLKIDNLESDYKALNDKYLRCLAEYDNFRKRTAKEKERIFSDGIIYSLKGILDVLDNFERALKCESQDTEMKKGFEMIFNQISEVIKKLGVEEIKTEGETFDPEVHNAVMHIEDETYGQNQIVETLQKGYKLRDNIIRYAMVKVAN